MAYVDIADGHTFNPFKHVEISGGPAWIYSDRYTIEAKPESPQSTGMMSGPMMQALLEDRFRLKLRREPKEVPVYILMVGKDGPKNLQTAREGNCISTSFGDPLPPSVQGELPRVCGLAHLGLNGYDVSGTTMAALCDQFSAYLDRSVIDKTGITGVFDIHLDLSIADLRGQKNDQANDQADMTDAYAAISAAVQEIGLKLEPARGPGESLVIAHIDKPNEN